MVDRIELGKTLNLEIDFIPESNSNRPGTRINPKYLTIHNTDNEDPGAGALVHAKYMKGADAQRRKVSWHFNHHGPVKRREIHPWLKLEAVAEFERFLSNEG
jgi:hypothetical protein